MAFTIFLASLSLVLPFKSLRPASDEPRWKTDFESFCSHVDRTAQRGLDLEKIFANTHVTWRLQFQGFPTAWRGPGGEYAALTLFFNTGDDRVVAKRLWFVTRAENRRDWQATTPGTWVTIRGRINSAWNDTEGSERRAYFEIVDVEAADGVARVISIHRKVLNALRPALQP